jgi:hypothetical protein
MSEPTVAETVLGRSDTLRSSDMVQTALKTKKGRDTQQDGPVNFVNWKIMEIHREMDVYNRQRDKKVIL